jgi:hypothetical protein
MHHIRDVLRKLGTLAQDSAESKATRHLDGPTDEVDWPMPKPPTDNALLDARMRDAKHLLRLEGDCVLSFALSDHDQEAEVLVLC